MSVKIDPHNVEQCVAQRQCAYVITATEFGLPHVRAVVTRWEDSRFMARVGSQTADNVARTGTITLLWPPRSSAECNAQYDDHTVIADCAASCTAGDDSYELVASPTSAVWHRPARR